MEDFERNTATLRGEQTGIFNLGVIDSTITDPMLPMSEIIATFSERFPLVHINLQVRSPNALLQGVLNNELDLAVGTFSFRPIAWCLTRFIANKTGSIAVTNTLYLPLSIRRKR
jgi:DNA-binding transcriptional LysR family regulator